KDPGKGELRIRLEIDPAESPDEVFVLKGDGGYEQKKTVKDDQVAGDKFVDLLFTDLPRDQSFTLRAGGTPLFDDVPYGELAHLSGDSVEPEIGVHDMIDEHPGAPTGSES